MRVDLFDFELPPELIAQAPIRPRDAARLLLVDDAPLRAALVRDLPDLLRPGDLLVLNETRVLPTRFFARRSDVEVEVTLVERTGDASWWALARPGKRLRRGDTVALTDDLTATVAGKDDEGRVRLEFVLSGEPLLAAIRSQGAMPLPPYIRRPRGGDAHDALDYQTVFARRDGAVAAPTASLHLTEDLLARLDGAGIARRFVTLHVGAGTFAPVKAEDTEGHAMHAEWCEIPAVTATAIAETRARGGRVVAVGTTSLRTLESRVGPDGTVLPGAGDTRLFVTPGYRFRVVDLLLTNFHLPRSTLFMLVAAFSGLERIKEAYAHAIAERFRFFSYGDACLLTRMAP
jgi:S-adenosylmethionine:tRNA ribosyltransferase-isomerase